MFSSKGKGLYANGFGGSHDEKHIFKEVFFGKDTAAPNRSVVGGSVDSDCANSKIAHMPFGSNSDNSAVTSQSSSKSLLVEDYNLKENLGRDSSSDFQERLEFHDQITGTKRMKLSVDDLSSSEPHPVIALTSSETPKEIIKGIPAEDGGLDTKATAFYIVESSSQGSVSSCYLSKEYTKLDEEHNVHDAATAKCMVGNGDENAEADKEVGICAGVSSPVSQESFASRIFLNNPSTTLAEKPGTMLAGESLKELDSAGLDVVDTSMMECKKDVRLLLQSHAFRIFLKMGWSIERRKRACRKYLETNFQSREGRSFREFPKAWRFCGQILCAHRFSAVQDNIKEWTNFSQFWSDLLDVLANIEKKKDQADLGSALAYQWSLLDPFVSVVLIERKIHSLKKGDTVRAVSSNLVKKNEKNDAVVVLTSEDGAIHHSVGRHLLTSQSHSSLNIQQSELTICEGSDKQTDRVVAGQLTVDFPDVANGTGNQCCTMCKENVNCLKSFIPPYPSDGSSGRLCHCCCDVSVSDGNANMLQKSESESPHQDSSLVDINYDSGQIDFSFDQDEQLFPQSIILDFSEKTKVCVEGEQFIQASRFQSKDFMKKKRKSRKISEIKQPSIGQNDIVDMYGNQLQVKDNLGFSSEINKMCNKVSPNGSSLHRVDKRGSSSKKRHYSSGASKRSQKKSAKCLIDDDDLLVSAIFKNKHCNTDSSISAGKRKTPKSRGRPKGKNPKGRCRLLPQNVSKVGNHHASKWSMIGQRTVLSWLVDNGVISFKDVIQYRNPKDDSIIKDGLVTKDGIMCRCCNEILSLSKFKNHAGFKLSRPCLNLFMESGQPFTLCQLQAWSDEYKLRKRRALVVRADDDDENDDSCGLCGDVGELVCCDNCPSTFHQACLSTEEIPEGSWYCPNCTCWICGELVNDREADSSSCAFKCSQCEHKYHGSCLRTKNISEESASGIWLCSKSCQEVYTGLSSLVGTNNHIADGFSWILLRCINEDQKVHSAQRFALKAECNSKLAVGLTIMEECFQPMLDPRTGIDMIPHVLYNWGSEFSRLNFQGFYTVVLEKDDVLLSVASIRIHGATVAEMPLIATCSKYRRQGMCRRLITAIEEMLSSLKVEKLVISAIPEVVETWTEGFGFTPVSADEKRSLSKINLMVFPGAVWLKKQLYNPNQAQTETEIGEASCSIEVGNHPVESLKQSDDVNDIKEIELDKRQDPEESNAVCESETTDNVRSRKSKSGTYCGGQANEDADELTVGEQGSSNLQDRVSFGI